MRSDNGAPPGWTEMRLQEFATLQRGFDLPVQKRNTGMVPVYAANGLVGHHDTAMVEGPGVVTGRSGTIGEVLYTERNFWPLNTALYVKDFHGNEPAYVYRFLAEFGLERFSSGTGVPTLNRNVVHKQRILVPARSIQRKIVQILNAVDDAVEATRAVIEQTHQIKTALLQDLLTHGLPGRHRTFKRMIKFGLVPSDWTIGTLDDCCEFLDEQRIPIKEEDRSRMRGPYPYYGASGVIDWINKYIFDEPLVLLAEDGENIRSRQLPIAVAVAGKIWVNNHTHVLRPGPSINRHYLVAFLGTIDLMPYSTGTAQPKLNRESSAKLRILLPTREEQDVIAGILQSLDCRIEAEQNHLAQQLNVKAALSQSLLTGRIPVSTTDKEVA